MCLDDSGRVPVDANILFAFLENIRFPTTKMGMHI